MAWLNYHHLLYFWTVATEGSIVAASKVLHLAPSTISVQIKELEENLGEPLFHRRGRQLVLTESGHVAVGYAEEIFSLGREMLDTLNTGMSQRPTRLSVGVSDVLPKLIVYRLLEPILEWDAPVHLICQEGPLEQLLGKLSTHDLDVVLTEAPLAPNIPIQAFNHMLGQSEVSIYGAQHLVDALEGEFPACLESQPFILPGTKTSLRRSLNAWFERMSVQIHEVADVDDRALMLVFAEKGMGFLAAPTILKDELKTRYGLIPVGDAVNVKERFYAVTLERRIKHPVVEKLSKMARAHLGASNSEA